MGFSLFFFFGMCGGVRGSSFVEVTTQSSCPVQVGLGQARLMG